MLATIKAVQQRLGLFFVATICLVIAVDIRFFLFVVVKSKIKRISCVRNLNANGIRILK